MKKVIIGKNKGFDEAIALLNKQEIAIYDTHCSLQLLCINKADYFGLTKENTYKCIEQNLSAYKIVNDFGDEMFYPKKHFK